MRSAVVFRVAEAVAPTCDDTASSSSEEAEDTALVLVVRDSYGFEVNDNIVVILDSSSTEEAGDIALVLVVRDSPGFEAKDDIALS